MIEFLINNWWQLLVGLIIIVLIIVGIVYRKQLKKKIEKETISFTALIVSLGLTLVSFITKQQTRATTLASINGREISLVIPLAGIFIVLSIIFLIIFFRKELGKKI